MSDRPRLWQYTFSNYNEKARWALDHKRIPHTRHSILPGSPRALWFSSRGTLPVMDLDGKRIVDSTRVIEELEARYPDRPLYPADADERARALELEDFFDENAGHDMRRVVFWDMRDDPDYLPNLLATSFGGAGHAFARGTSRVAWAYAARRYTFREADTERSRERIVAALDRIESERNGRDHLVGDDFSIADLAAAALLYPLAWPPELPYAPPEPREWPFRDSLADHPSVAWIGETYTRYRGTSAEAG